jgi:hypothetical protein
MPIIAKKPESNFTPCPEGLHQAVCVDVVDLGLNKGPFGEKHKVELRWQTELENEDVHPPRRFQLRKWYTLSLHEKASLRKDLECWRGRKFTEDELKGFDLEKLIGANCQLQVIHNITDDGKTYDNIQAIVPHNSKLPKIAAQDYTREKDRAKQHGNGVPESEFDGEPVPF